MKYLITTAILATNDQALMSVVSLDVSVDGAVDVMTIDNLVAISNSHLFINQIGGGNVQLFIDVDVRIQAVSGSSFEVLSDGKPLYNNVIATSVNKLKRGKVYLIENTYAQNLLCIPSSKAYNSCLDVYQTMNEGDGIPVYFRNARTFVFIAFEDTNFVNLSGNVPVVQMDVDLNVLAENQKTNAVKSKNRKTQLLNFPQSN
ncbi:MAG: hypothetical protein FADNKDHG_01469 [Holosporales bacterium]